MPRHTSRLVAATVIGLTIFTGSDADESSDVSKQQKEATQANWKKVFDEESPVPEETAHFLIVTQFPEKLVKDLAASLEKEYTLASKALHLDPKEEVWTGKLTVYVFDERRQFNSFIRGFAKKRADPDELGLFSLRGARPYLIAGPGPTKSDPSAELQAGEQLAQALLTRKAGSTVPDWISAGFGRASVWRAAPGSAATVYQRQLARNLVSRKGRTAKDVWNGNLSADEAAVLRGSLVDYLAYGPGAGFFLGLLEGFKPEEGMEKKTVIEALKSVKINPDRLEKAWQAWAVRGRF